jgi:ATP-dependent DNA helicase RecG
MNSSEIRKVYLELLTKMKSKRPAYALPKYSAQLISNPDSANDILLNRVYSEMLREMLGLLEIASVELDTIPEPPILSPSLKVHEEKVIISLPICDKKTVENLVKLPAADYNEEANELHFPLSASLIPYLRSSVKDLNLSVDKESASLLKNIDTNSTTTDLAIAFLSIKENKVYLKLRYKYIKLAEQISKLSTTPHDLDSREYYFPIGIKENIITLLEDFKVKTIFAENFNANTIRFEPFDFNGDINQLYKIPITELKGVKDKRASKFLQHGIKNILDLLYTLPRKYIDKSNPIAIKNIREGDDVAFIANVDSIDMNYPRKMLRITLQDSTGKIIATFFNSAWLAKKFVKGEQVLVYGKADGWGAATARKVSLTNPTIEKFENISAAIIPIYPQSQKAGVSSGDIYNAVSQSLERLPTLYDEIDIHLGSPLGLLEALKKIHKPLSMQDVDKAYEYMVESELLKMQLFLLLQKEWMTSQQGNPYELSDMSMVGKAIPFSLTSAQQRAIEEIREDLTSEKPMNRLLQGDVGSGKTMVAASAMVSLLANNPNAQGAIMAPTEILATQLYNDFKNFFAKFSEGNDTNEISVALFTNKLKPKEKAELYNKLSSGEIQLAVGTHALIAEKIDFNNLSFVIIDEQHRFGVNQRALLSAKSKSGGNPDLLIMTATPIPRTAALTVFGSVDISTLDELPPGRTPIETIWHKGKVDLTSSETTYWKDALAEIKLGRQCYVVCPLVEDNDKLELASAEETFITLSARVFKDYKVALVHGQQKADERAQIMNDYKLGLYDVLVSTTVIEVGVNVPNASIMIILDAERFGISQLHQLRGRVGRGAHKSKCYLVSDAKGDTSNERLQALVDSTDGFYLSEIDLSIRGHGQLFGEAQSGMSDLRVANLDEHGDMVEVARNKALEIMSKDAPEALLRLISSEKSLDNIFRA